MLRRCQPQGEGASDGGGGNKKGGQHTFWVGCGGTIRGELTYSLGSVLGFKGSSKQCKLEMFLTQGKGWGRGSSEYECSCLKVFCLGGVCSESVRCASHAPVELCLLDSAIRLSTPGA